MASPVGASSSAMAPRKPVATSSVKAWVSDLVIRTPTEPAVPRARARAAGSGPTYPSSAAAASTFSRSSAESWSGREKALDTVIRLTPTLSATVCRVTRATGVTLGAPPRRRPGGQWAGTHSVGETAAAARSSSPATASRVRTVRGVARRAARPGVRRGAAQLARRRSAGRRGR